MTCPKKAISPIIAIIIILLITIAIAGAGYSYISTYWTILVGKEIAVTSAFCAGGNQGRVMVRNIGTNPVKTSEITVINPNTGEDLSQDVLWSGEIADSGLVLQFGFDEGSGTLTNDTSGQGNDGTLYNGTEVCSNSYCPTWVDGKMGGALEFDGDGDHVNAGNINNWNPNAGNSTIALWLKPNRIDILMAAFSDQWGPEMGIWVNSDGRVFGIAYQRVYSKSEILVNRWYYAALVFDIDEKKIAFYLNGELQGETNMSIGNGLRDRPYNVARDPAGVYYYSGLIDEVRIYNRTLSPEEISILAGDFPVKPGDTATLTHTCSGRCRYSLVLGWGVKEAMLEC